MSKIKLFTNHFFAILSVSLMALTIGITDVWPNILISNFSGNKTDEQIPFRLRLVDYSNVVLMILVSITTMFPAAYISERFGRKSGLLLSSFLYVISWIIIVAIQTYTAFYTALFVMNLGRGIFLTIIPVYLSEISKDSKRGQYTAFLPYMIMIGETIEIIFSLYVTWSILIGINLFISLLFLIVFAFQCESPYYYLIHDRVDEAEEALKLFLEIDDVSKELSDAKKFVEEGKNIEENWIKILYTKRNKKLYLTISLIFTILVLSKGSAYTHCISKIYEISQVDEYTKIQFSLMILNITISIFPVITTDRFGRKYLLCVSIFGVLIFHVFSGVYFYHEIHEPLEAVKFNSTFMVLFIITTFLRNIGLTSIPYTLVSELFPMKIKSNVNATIQFKIVIAYIINALSFSKSVNNNNIFVSYWTYAFISLVGLIIIIFYLPETKRLSLSSLQEALK